ncbi:hypothetical protein [Phenylobacterium sp.]|uniref:hypothetical protein n=1 Tax=Phenylobacterium sp. TaxID=1871053 RepID=UPI002F9558CF
MRQSLLRLVSENYPAVARDLLKPLLDICSLSREACGGDMDKFLILLVVGVRTTEHPEFRRLTQEELLSGDIPVFPGLATNVRSISDSLQIPKETVRRKVAELVDAGWLARTEAGLFFTAAAYRSLVPVREAVERQAVLNFETVDGLLRQKG